MRLPKYQIIRNKLKSEIISGKFESGDRFYTEAELVHLYQVSSITVIRALNELVQEGYLVRYQGKGTFISRSRKGRLVEFSDLEVYPLEKEKVTVLSIDKGDDPKILQLLELTAKDHYYCIRRIRSVNGTPFIYHKTYLNSHLVNTNLPKNAYSSIYNRIKVDFGIHMSEEPYEETNEILYPAPKEVATLLDLPSNDPIVKQVKLTRSSFNDKPLEYIITHKRWDYYKFKVKG
ncbi:GntR family transcriptional regulator [Atopobacter sp. AH10]|uniref:GntR family transcriptional regulator n=1 Tax=Atopobacter sp. AH10 TaxID=2315861 RepID=UPI000EF24FBC|nr:GntR family transcriptional regulator [Atopobacter sp. AH10]RLK64246.1 GntR family transcriptional regulator [Atopobacter sp. AH10]